MEPFERTLQPELWDEKKTAAFCGCSVSTLQKDRHFSRGLPYVKLGGRLIRYMSTDVIGYCQMHRIVPGQQKSLKAEPRKDSNNESQIW